MQRIERFLQFLYKSGVVRLDFLVKNLICPERSVSLSSNDNNIDLLSLATLDQSCSPKGQHLFVKCISTIWSVERNRCNFVFDID